MENVDIFYDHLVNFVATCFNLHMAIWYTLWQFVILSILVVIYLVQEKSGSPVADREK
jgi:hypothetical protein